MEARGNGKADGLELADVRRVARHSVDKWVRAARAAEEPTSSSLAMTRAVLGFGSHGQADTGR